jgi:hypothetical protein
MFERLKAVNALTMVFLIGAIVALVVMVTNGWTAQEVAVVAGALTTIASQLDRLFAPAAPAAPPEPPPGAVILPFAVSLGVALALGACASPQARAAAAEAEYLHEQLRCVDAEPPPRADAGVEERRAAWTRVDACRAAVLEHWGIATKDGGR